MKIENIEEGVEEDPVPALPNSENEESKVDAQSITEPTESVTESVTESHPRLVPYFKVLSPVPTISVSSLKGESPYSDREDQALTSEEDDKEFEDPVNNSVESNSTQSMETSTHRYILLTRSEQVKTSLNACKLMSTRQCTLRYFSISSSSGSSVVQLMI